MTDTSIPAETRIGHVHLKVADLERAIAFYRDYLGFDLLFNMGSAAFLSAGGYHHHIVLTPGRARMGRSPHPARLACITSPSTIRRAKIWPSRSNACSIMAGRSTERQIMAPTRPSTCTMRISTGSSWPGTDTQASGRARTERLYLFASRSTSRAC